MRALALATSLLLAGVLIQPAAASDAVRHGPSQAATSHATDISAAKRKKKRATGYQAYGSGGQQIACTQLGCNPIPRGCRVVPGKIPFTWDPSGFDDVVCPYPR